MKGNKVTSINVSVFVNPALSPRPFVSVFFNREVRCNRTMYDPTPSTMLRVMRWQSATLLASMAKAQS